MNVKPLFFHLLLVSILFLNCHNLTGFTPPGNPAPLRIAVIPCEITKPWSDYSGLEKLRIETSLSMSLQAEIYRHLLERVLAQHSSTVALQAFSDTNDLLNAMGIRPQEAWQLSTAELASLLNVDAILRVSIHQLAGSAVKDPGIPGGQHGHEEYFIDRDETRVSAGLFDGTTGIPLWSIGQPHPVSRGRKHKTIARQLIRELGQKLP